MALDHKVHLDRFKKPNNPHLVVAQHQEGPREHDGHAEEEDEENGNHGDGSHDSVPLLDVVIEVLAVAELVAVAVGYLEKALESSVSVQTGTYHQPRTKKTIHRCRY